MKVLKAPFTYFGGKSRIAGEVWQRFGKVPNYVEPFCGSCAVLLARPHAPKTETVNDKNGYITNFWRAVQAEPEAVARWADNPVFENDLHARNIWCLNRYPELVTRLEGDPDYYDAKIAGWWVWGQSCSIRCTFGTANGSWQSVDGRMVKTEKQEGVKREMPGLLAKRGVVSIANGVKRAIPAPENGRGVLKYGGGLHLSDGETGVIRLSKSDTLLDYFLLLQARIKRVTVLSGDWARCTGESVTVRHGVTAVFLDPPYSHNERDNQVYTEEMECASSVREWAIENGSNPLLRIALCGYEGEHKMPADWECLEWKANGGYGNQGEKRGRENAKRERIWFSPHCLKPSRNLFEEEAEA